MCLPGRGFHLQCICISTNTQRPKATRGWKNQGSIFQQESGPNQSRNSILGPIWEAQQLGPRSVAPAMPGPHCPLPHTVLVTWGQGTGLSLPEPQDWLLPGLLTFCDQRQGEQARIGTRRLSTFSEFQVRVRSRGMCMYVSVYVLRCAHHGRKARFRGSELGRVFKIDSGFIYFLFSLIAINWLLIGWNVQLSISSNTIK